MAAPSFRAVGTRVNTDVVTTGISPGLPTGWQTGDLHVMVDVITVFGNADETLIPTFTALPAGWNQFVNPATSIGHDSTDTNARRTRMRLSWRIAEGGDAAPTVATNNDNTGYTAGSFVHRSYILGFSGTHQTAPIDVSAWRIWELFGSTAFSVAGVTTTQDETLVVGVIGLGDDNIAGSSPAFTDPATPDERLDEATAVGGDQWSYVVTGTKATAGATGNFTVTLSTSDPGGAAVFAIAPPAAAPSAGTVGGGLLTLGVG